MEKYYIFKVSFSSILWLTTLLCRSLRCIQLHDIDFVDLKYVHAVVHWSVSQIVLGANATKAEGHCPLTTLLLLRPVVVASYKWNDRQISW